MGKKNKNKNKKPAAAPAAAAEPPREDFLRVDTAIPGQSHVCLSFISPDDLIKKKELFYMMHLLRDIFARDEKVEELRKKVADNSANYSYMKTLYDDFVYTNPHLANLFDEQNEYRTSIRGIKIRGTYATEKEATIRAKHLQESDPTFHVYVGQVGYWLPWEPDPDSIEGQEYGDNDLNNLMHKYRENKAEKDKFFELEKERKKQEAAAAALEQKKQNLNERKLIEGATTDAETQPKPDGTHAKKIRELREIANAKEDAIPSGPAGPAADNKVEQKIVSSLFDSDDPWLQAKLRKK